MATICETIKDRHACAEWFTTVVQALDYSTEQMRPENKPHSKVRLSVPYQPGCGTHVKPDKHGSDAWKEDRQHERPHSKVVRDWAFANEPAVVFVLLIAIAHPHHHCGVAHLL